MKISGFTMCKNASKLYYPVKASITSILPIVDEFIVAVGDCDEDDDTLEQIESINSDKIRIVKKDKPTSFPEKISTPSGEITVFKPNFKTKWQVQVQYK